MTVPATIHPILDIAAYWVLFWTLVNILLPPREIFATASDKTKARYELILKLVAYYGAMNLRQVSVKLYSAVNEQPPAPPSNPS